MFLRGVALRTCRSSRTAVAERPRNATPTRFNLKERVAEGEWLDQVEALDGVPRRRTTVTIEHPKSILTRNSSPDIGFDRSINAYPRVRAWLHLLLRAADPRLSRPVARRGFRIAAVREAQGGAIAPRGAVAPRLRMPADRDGHQHRSLSADRGALADHALGDRAAARDPPPVHHHHQVRPRAARSRPLKQAAELGIASVAHLGDVARPARSPGRWNRAHRSRASASPRSRR